MAGIEKICEFSGEYPGWLMWGYKRNQLQIMPRYRKLFRYTNHKLIIKFERLVWVRSSMQWDYNNKEWNQYEPPFQSEKEFINWYKSKGNHLLKEYKYTLKVFDKKLLGRVNGKYINWSTDLNTVKRKLKRMFRCKKLNIEYLK